MTVSYWQDSNEPKTIKEVDAGIIGGGIMGAAAAYWLSKRKGLRVAMLEAGSLASGASGRDAGFAVRTLFAYYNQATQIYGRETARTLLQLNETSLAYLTEIANKYGGNKFAYEKCGSYLLACTDEESSDLSESAQLMREDGFEQTYFKTDPLERGSRSAPTE